MNRILGVTAATLVGLSVAGWGAATRQARPATPRRSGCQSR